MTGFTRTTGQHGDVGWTWEIRSVNGRGLDVRVRLPSGYESLEAAVRDAAGKALTRGSVAISLNLNRAASTASYRVNRELLGQLIEVAGAFKDDDRLAVEPPRLEHLLAVRGVVEPSEESGDAADTDERNAAVVGSLKGALDQLVAARQAEGTQLDAILRARLTEMSELRMQAEEIAALRADTIRERLRDQVEQLLQASPALPEERLAQEAALLAVKADVREELDRLGAHVQGAGALLDEGGAIGRRLDFLCQEFNRETNTLCSKSGDIELTRVGLALKAVIDQFREQALNVE